MGAPAGNQGMAGGAGPDGPARADSPVVVVANRLPVDQVIDPDGSTRWQRSPGGLVTALEPFVAGRGGGWGGWAGSAGGGPGALETRGVAPIPGAAPRDEGDRYYQGMAKPPVGAP